MLPYFRPYRSDTVWGLLLVVVANLFGTAKPFFVGVAIDAVTVIDAPRAGGEVISRMGFREAAVLLVVVALLGGAARFGMRKLLNGVSRRIEVDLRNDFFAHLMRLGAPFYSANRTGDIMTRVSQDTVAVRMAAGPAIMYTVNTLVGFSFALVLMLWISPRLTAMTMIPMILLPPLVMLFGGVIHRRYEKIQEQFSSMSTMVQENLTGVRIVRAYGQEASQAETFDQETREYLKRNMGLIKIAGALHPIMQLIAGIAMVIVLWVGGLEIMAGRITIGDLVAFMYYLALLIWPLIALGWVINLYQRGAASMGRIWAIMSTEPQVTSPERPVPLPGAPAPIEFRKVRFRYPGTERDVLTDISFTVQPGQRVAIVGPTGSGKSTLVSLLARIYDPTDGEIRLGSHRLQDYDLAELRGVIGAVPQDSFLFSDTIGANLALGLDARDPRIEAAARVAQLDETVRAFPKGYETELGERGINLSGGQKQRATLARALARDPWILILDDSLSAVDTQTEARILADLGTELEDRTAFVISHRVSAVMDADLILVLDEGRIVERGTHADLVRAGGLYAGLLRRQLLEQDLEAVS